MTFIPTYAPVDCDGGATAANLNTLTSPGAYVGTDANVNAPPIPTGQYLLEVRTVSGGTIIQQRTTHLTLTNYIANRLYTSGAWGAWHSPAAGFVASAQGPGSTSTSSTILTLATSVVAGRSYLLSGSVLGSNAAIATIRIFMGSNLSGTIALGTGMYLYYDTNTVNTPAGGARAVTGSMICGPMATTGSQSFYLSNPGTASAYSVAANQAQLYLSDVGTG